tara:strand:- start:71 stop:202 length:132 start_codon:yes stop_codon:yes gene_type:complete
VVEEELEQALLEEVALLDLEVVEQDLDIKTQEAITLHQIKMET